MPSNTPDRLAGLRGFVLAAGFGTRLRPLSRAHPKPAWPLFDVPLAGRVLGLIRAAGVEEVVVNLHHRPDRLREALAPWLPDGMPVRWSEEKAILGTGGALEPWRGWLSTGTFVLANGDTFQELDLAAMAAFHRDRAGAATLSVRPAPPGGDAPLELGPDGRIVRFLDARAPGRAGGLPVVFTGVHLLEPSVLDRLPAGPCCINADVHRRAVAAGEPVFGFVSRRGFWSDLGTPERYLSAHLELLRLGRVPRAPGRVWGEDGKTGDGGRVRAPSYLGPGARVMRGAVAGPGAVLGAAAVVEPGAAVEQAVVWAGARIGPPGLRRVVLAPGHPPLQVP